MPLYPILLEPIYKEKVWGGRALERLGRSLPGDATTRIGESWEVADLAATAASGGGGSAARSVIANGALAGLTLSDLMRDHADVLLGADATARDPGAFPLLVKYLDARQNLSVQVHPSEAYAARHPEAHLKSEAWYVVEAEPGAVIYKGVVAGTSRADFERAVHDGTVPELLIEVPVVAGDCHYLPSGTCHALGAGILVAEVQTPSDTTFRVYDWGRTDREIHVAAALECIDYGPVTADTHGGSAEGQGGDGVRSLVACPHFGIDEWRAQTEIRRDVDIVSPEVWMVIDGWVEIRSALGRFDAVRAGVGQTVLLPASLGPTAVAGDGPLVMLRVTLPSGTAVV